MQNRNHKINRTVCIFIFWVVSWLILNMIMISINVYRTLYHVELSYFLGVDILFYIPLLAIVGFFLPLLFVIHRRAGNEGIKWLRIVSKILLIFLIFYFALAVIILLGTIFLT